MKKSTKAPNFFNIILKSILVVGLVGITPIFAATPTPTPIPDPTATATPSPTPATNYEINVRTSYQGSLIAGIGIKLNGNGLTKDLTSATSAVTFNSITAGSYVISVTIPDSIAYLLADGSSSSQNVTLTADNSSQTITFELKQRPAPVDQNWEKIKAIVLPAEFTKIGSTSTLFSKLDKTKLNSVTNFTFDNPGINKIVYTSPLDFSNAADLDQIGTLSDYLKLDKIGKISFNTDLFTVFNKPAKLTMSKVRLVAWDSEPIAIIGKDGVAINNLTDLSYKNNELSFSVPGFSTYEIMPRLNIELTGLTKDPNEDNTYISSSDLFAVNLKVDNLDATVKVTNNGEIINLPTQPDEKGNIVGEIKLIKGINRIRINAILANGESAEQYLTIKYQVTPESIPNNVSSSFGIAFFLLIIIAGIGVGLYYLRTTKKKGVVPVDPTEKKPKYEQALLTDEEKELYDQTPADDPNTTLSMENSAVKETSENVNKEQVIDTSEVKQN